MKNTDSGIKNSAGIVKFNELLEEDEKKFIAVSSDSALKKTHAAQIFYRQTSLRGKQLRE